MLLIIVSIHLLFLPFLNMGHHSILWKVCFVFQSSSSAFDTGLRNEDLVKAEAVHNCKYLNKWSGFLSILALSSVTNMEICSHYPDCGLLKYKLLFNQTIMPRVLKKPCLKLHILFCYEGNLPVGNFHHNHYRCLYLKM